MPSAEEVAAGLMAAGMAVKPPSPGVCEICCGGVANPYTSCWPCHDLAKQLGERLTPITPISLTTDDSQIYTALKQYKSGRRPIADRQGLQVAALTAVFLRRHLGCIAPDGVDTVLVVPSFSGRTPPHPLAGVLARISSLPAVLDCLVARPGRIHHGHASADAVSCTESMAGRRVLLVDDTYTTGASLQSVVHAARAAGAVAVTPLVIGRRVRADWAPSAPLLQWARAHPWDPSRCIHCDGRDLRGDPRPQAREG